MKIIPSMFATFVAVAKLNLSGWYILLALLLSSIMLSGCENESETIYCPVGPECTTEVIAESVVCGYGAFGGVWFKTLDGKYLQPWHNKTEITGLVAGQKYKIGYTPTEKDDKYNDVYTCMVGLPAAQVVTLLCLSATTNN